MGGCGEKRRALLPETAAGHHRSCQIAVNAGFFNVSDGGCLGHLISDSRIVQSTTRRNAIFGMTQSGFFVTGYSDADWIREAGFRQLVNGVIWLVRNSLSAVQSAIETESAETQSTGSLADFAAVRSARTAIGHDREGNLILVQIDGQTSARGLSLFDFSRLLIEMGLVNAINLDGGGSASLYINNTLANYPSDHCEKDARWRCSRYVSSAICITCPSMCEHGSCDVNGECECDPGWRGEQCDQPFCARYNCSNAGICSEGKCHCFPGFTGPDCRHVCDFGTWGRDCRQICQCLNDAFCEPASGKCTCPWGYEGPLCSQVCVGGTYGPSCKYRCPFGQVSCAPESGSMTHSDQLSYRNHHLFVLLDLLYISTATYCIFFAFLTLNAVF